MFSDREGGIIGVAITLLTLLAIAPVSRTGRRLAS